MKSFEYQDLLFAAILPGNKGSTHSAPGDAVLIDLDLGILAVADGPERNPSASARFLERFHALAEASTSFDPGGHSLDEHFESIVAETNDLLLATSYHENTTFSALIIGGDNRAVLLHTGDSLVYLISGADRRVTQISRSNHFMVGRAPRLFQTEVLTVTGGDLVLLATDGLTDLARCHKLPVDRFLLHGLNGGGPRCLSDSIIARSGTVEVDLDDLSIIVADPRSVRSGVSHPARRKKMLRY